MIIYNITSVIPEDIHEEWLDWMQHTHIPSVLATGKFTKARLLKVLVVGESGGHTYSMQFYTENKATLDKYYREDAERLRNETAAKFGEQIHSFRTELQIICDHQSI